jgi:sigma-E factor negative regulatory protein RseC
MEQLVRVRTCNPDGTAEVVCVRESACSGDCHKCSGCGAAKETILLEAQNPIGAQPGAMVLVRSESGPVLLGAAVLYMIPLLLFFVGYFVADAMWGLGALGGAVAFIVGIAAAVVYDRLVAKKQKAVYTIVGYAHRPNT